MFQVYVAYRDPATGATSPELPHPDLRLSDAWGEWMAFQWNAGELTHYPPEAITVGLLNTVYSGTISYNSPVVADTISFMNTLGPWMDYAAWRVEHIEE